MVGFDGSGIDGCSFGFDFRGSKCMVASDLPDWKIDFKDGKHTSKRNDERENFACKRSLDGDDRLCGQYSFAYHDFTDLLENPLGGILYR